MWSRLPTSQGQLPAMYVFKYGIGFSLYKGKFPPPKGQVVHLVTIFEHITFTIPLPVTKVSSNTERLGSPCDVFKYGVSLS